MIVSPIESFLKTQLEKPAEDSKKYRMAIIGLKGVAGIFVLTAIMMFVKPEIASSIVILAQFTMTAWGGIVAMSLGAQGAVDFKTTAAIENVQKTENIKQEIIVTEKYDPAVEEEFARRYAGDESYRPPATTPKEKEGWTRPDEQVA